MMKKQTQPMQIRVMAMMCFFFNFSFKRMIERIVLKRIVMLLVLARRTWFPLSRDQMLRAEPSKIDPKPNSHHFVRNTDL